MSVSGEILTKRTNCGKPIYHFSYEKDRVILQAPCFEPTCNTCALRQPAVSRFESVISPKTVLHPTFDFAQELARRKRQCVADVDEQLRRLGQLHVKNAPQVKLAGGRLANEAGRRRNMADRTKQKKQRAPRRGVAPKRNDLKLFLVIGKNNNLSCRWK